MRTLGENPQVHDLNDYLEGWPEDKKARFLAAAKQHNIRFVGGDGSSDAEAIAIEADGLNTMQGLMLERLIMAKLRPVQMTGQRTADLGAGRIADVISFDGMPDLWFDITAFYGK